MATKKGKKKATKRRRAAPIANQIVKVNIVKAKVNDKEAAPTMYQPMPMPMSIPQVSSQPIIIRDAPQSSYFGNEVMERMRSLEDMIRQQHAGVASSQRALAEGAPINTLQGIVNNPALNKSVLKNPAVTFAEEAATPEAKKTRLVVKNTPSTVVTATPMLPKPKGYNLNDGRGRPDVITPAKDLPQNQLFGTPAVQLNAIASHKGKNPEEREQTPEIESQESEAEEMKTAARGRARGKTASRPSMVNDTTFLAPEDSPQPVASTSASAIPETVKRGKDVKRTLFNEIMSLTDANIRDFIQTAIPDIHVEKRGKKKPEGRMKDYIQTIKDAQQKIPSFAGWNDPKIKLSHEANELYQSLANRFRK
jgi:hypothetical protein